MLTINQMHQHILHAYLYGKALNKVGVEFKKNANGETDINVYEYVEERAQGISIYEFHNDELKKMKFEKVIDLLTGKISLFDETPIQRETRTTEDLF